MLKGVINMLKGLMTKIIAEPIVKEILKEAAQWLISLLVQKSIVEVQKLVGKFIPVGGYIFGRRYAITLTVSENPPAGHPKAIHLGVVGNKDWGVEFHLWGVSFPKERWEKLPESVKVHLQR